MQPFVNKKGGHKYEEKGISTGADRSNGGYSIGRLRKQRRHWFCIHNTAASEDTAKDDTAAADTEEDGDYYVDEDGNKYKKFDDVQLKMLVCWNGGFNTADDQYNNEVAAAIRDKIGVTVEFEGIMMSEDEKLNMMFASRRYARYDQCALLGGQLRFDWDHQKGWRRRPSD